MSDLFGATTALAKPVDDWPPDHEAQFWRRYPKRVAKIAAMKALAKVRKMGIPWSVLMAGVDRYAVQVERSERRFIAHPATWLNAGRWDDEPDPGGGKRRSFADIARGL